MSDTEDLDPIAASLRRQLMPPALDRLQARVDAAVRDRDQPPREAPRNGAQTTRALPIGFAVILAAAAILLLLLRPQPATTPREDAAPSPVAVAPPTASQKAGRLLDAFLTRRAMLPGDDAACAVAEPPLACMREAEYPHLIANASVRQVGECGGATPIACADFDLPAERALLVQLAPDGDHAIVCIEHPWTDPHPELPVPSAYNIFRSELGAYVIYEITPLSSPRATEFLRL